MQDSHRRSQAFAVRGLLHGHLEAVIPSTSTLPNTPGLLLEKAAFSCSLQHSGCCQSALPCVGTSCLSCLSCTPFSMLCIVTQARPDYSPCSVVPCIAASTMREQLNRRCLEFARTSILGAVLWPPPSFLGELCLCTYAEKCPG